MRNIDILHCKWWTYPKIQGFGLFSITTRFKICIFSMFALIARRSKYDFWIPGGILTLEIKIQIKKIFFRDRKFWSKKKIENFFGPKKNSDPKIGKSIWILKNDFPDFWIRKKKWSEKKSGFFFRSTFSISKKYLFDLNFCF